MSEALNILNVIMKKRFERLELLERSWLDKYSYGTPCIDGPTAQVLRQQLCDIKETLEQSILNLELFDEKVKQYEKTV